MSLRDLRWDEHLNSSDAPTSHKPLNPLGIRGFWCFLRTTRASNSPPLLRSRGGAEARRPARGGGGRRTATHCRFETTSWQRVALRDPRDVNELLIGAPLRRLRFAAPPPPRERWRGGEARRGGLLWGSRREGVALGGGRRIERDGQNRGLGAWRGGLGQKSRNDWWILPKTRVNPHSNLRRKA
jgi:hypothetical protein